MRVLFFGGKGGVGKTTLSGAYAVGKAEQGKRVLLVSVDPAHSLKDLFGGELPRSPRAVEIDLQEELKKYEERVRRVVKESLRYGSLSEDLLRNLLRTPGVEEVVLAEALARLLYEARREYELAVIDTAPTGHTLAFLRSVRTLGPTVRKILQLRKKANLLRSYAKAEERKSFPELEERERYLSFLSHLIEEHAVFIPVLVPERLPLLETERLLESLKEEGLKVGALVVNKVLPQTGDEFTRRRRALQDKYLGAIERKFGDLPRVYIPLMAEEVVGREKLLQIFRDYLSGL